MERSSTRAAWKKEEQEHEKKLVDLAKKYEARKEATDAYSSLRLKGVDDNALLRWNRILDDIKLDPKVLEAELMETSNLKHVQAEIEAENQRLRGDQQELSKSAIEVETKIKDLTGTRDELNSSIQLTKDNLKTQLEELAKAPITEMNKNAQSAKDLLEDAKENITQLESKAKELSKTTKPEIDKSVDDLKTSISDTKKEITELLEEARTAGEKIGKLEPIVRAYEFLISASGSKEEVVPALLGLLYNLKIWCNYKNYPIDLQIDELMERLKEM